VACSSHRDLELVARLAMILEAGGCQQGPWTDDKYDELCAMLPPPGRAALPRSLCRLLNDKGTHLYTGRTLPLVLSQSAQDSSSGEAGLTTVAVPELPDVPLGSLVGNMLLLSVHMPSSSTHGSRRDVLCERGVAHSLGTPGGGFLAPPVAAAGKALLSQGRIVSRDSMASFLSLNVQCLARDLAQHFNPTLAARSYRLVIEGEKMQGPVFCKEVRAVRSPFFAPPKGEDSHVIALQDIMVRDKGMDSCVLLEVSVWGGAHLAKASWDRKLNYYKLPPSETLPWHPPLALSWTSVGGCIVSLNELVLLSKQGVEHQACHHVDNASSHYMDIGLDVGARQSWHNGDGAYQVWQRSKDRASRAARLAMLGHTSNASKSPQLDVHHGQLALAPDDEQGTPAPDMPIPPMDQPSHTPIDQLMDPLAEMRPLLIIPENGGVFRLRRGGVSIKTRRVLQVSSPFSLPDSRTRRQDVEERGISNMSESDSPEVSRSSMRFSSIRFLIASPNTIESAVTQWTTGHAKEKGLSKDQMTHILRCWHHSRQLLQPPSSGSQDGVFIYLACLSLCLFLGLCRTRGSKGSKGERMREREMCREREMERLMQREMQRE